MPLPDTTDATHQIRRWTVRIFTNHTTGACFGYAESGYEKEPRRYDFKKGNPIPLAIPADVRRFIEREMARA